jgi:hypothetical protein
VAEAKLTVGEGIKAFPELHRKLEEASKEMDQRVKEAARPAGVNAVETELLKDEESLRQHTEQLWAALLVDASPRLWQRLVLRVLALRAGISPARAFTRASQLRERLPHKLPWSDWPGGDIPTWMRAQIRVEMLRIALLTSLRAIRRLRNWRRVRIVLRMLRTAPAVLVGAGVFALGGVAVDKTFNFGWTGAICLALGLWFTENLFVEPRLENWAENKRIVHVQRAAIELGRLQFKSYDVPFLDDLREQAKIQNGPPGSQRRKDVTVDSAKGGGDEGSQATTLAGEKQATQGSETKTDSIGSLAVGMRVRVRYISLGITVCEGVIAEISTTEHNATPEAPMVRVQQDDGESGWYPWILVDPVTDQASPERTSGSTTIRAKPGPD